MRPSDGDSPPGAGDRLPPLSPRGIEDGRYVSRRRPARSATVVVFLPTNEVEASVAYVAALAERHDRLRIWGARAFIVAADTQPIVDRLRGIHAPFEWVADADGEIRRRWALQSAQAAVFIADRWGEVFHAETGGEVRDLATPAEIEEWLKYLATQCAECGVPDEPGHGEWASA